ATCPRLDDIFEVFAQVGRALQRVHDAELVHRDVKPGNILVSAERVAKLLDLGIARRLTPRPDQATTSPQEAAASASAPRDLQHVGTLSGLLTEEGAMVGTPAYMSPEQLVCGELTPASDQFALAV